jgi:ubiquinone/menaquinone biosynthesis C-methylase UbiE
MAAKVSKGYKGIGMDGLIATWYASITAKDIEEYRKDARRITERVTEKSSILELAPGPGYLAIELAKMGNYKVSGLDISPKFVEIARAKARKAQAAVNFRRGDAGNMPFSDRIFDFIICRAAFKNFAEPINALNEMYRVMKIGGTGLILDLRGDVSPEAINQYVDKMGLNPINTLITKLTFKTSLIKRAYTKAQFESMLAQSDFKRYEIDETDIGLEVWLHR